MNQDSNGDSQGKLARREVQAAGEGCDDRVQINCGDVQDLASDRIMLRSIKDEFCAGSDLIARQGRSVNPVDEPQFGWCGDVKSGQKCVMQHGGWGSSIC